MSFKITPSNNRVLCVYARSGHNSREQLTRGSFPEGLQNCMENRDEVNENKITLRDFDCTMDKMDRDSGNKTQTIYRCGYNYVMSKLIVDNGL